MPTAVRALGEIALRVNDLAAMRAYYAETFGLEEIGGTDQMAFFKLADGYAGHSAILALFDRGVAVDASVSTVDHFAFTIELADYAAEKARLEGLGLEVRVAEHAWVQWRSLFVDDPEGNTVELVCFDPSIRKRPLGG